MDPKSNPDNAHLPVSNRPETILGVTIAFLIIASTAVSMRLYVRTKQKLWGVDDLFVTLAIAAVAAGSTLTCLMPDDGLGLHFWTLDADIKIQYFKHVWASNVTYTASTTFIKLAILIQYLRLFEVQQRLARKLTWGLLAVTSVWGLVYICLALFSCSPIAKNWHYLMPGKCIGWGSKDPDHFFVSWVAHNATNLLLDILILLLPAPFFKKLRMTGKTRLGLISLFIMGAIACSLSLARVIALSYRRVGTIPVFDVTYYTATVYIFSVLEIDIAIICASIPIFWPLVASFASNKILIVNEIEVRTERRSEAIGLAEHGHAGFGEMDFDGDGRASRMSMSVLAAKSDIEKEHRSPSHLQRSMSRQHRHKRSSTSSHKAVGISIGARPSQDSQRDLNPNLTPQTSNHSFGSSNKSAGLAPSPDNTHARYADKYTQEWAVPNFDSGIPVPTSPERAFTTTVERAEVPYDHIRALEK
ncbi:hypothetical protein K458DRAFT_352169 [Lentithecium fluviatile CBS 122367]|uniref:Rhodopsin domain-containing protein n=1 Tax=Lentithecium fluviatile CBS 122367 TaxID=1168545 RepID=A0A6G1IDA0_9PLEO|nr:hypothetical protein K458DRAFT_352169 [Lentithecium fluviatile CBS 122367]